MAAERLASQLLVTTVNRPPSLTATWRNIRVYVLTSVERRSIVPHDHLSVTRCADIFSRRSLGRLRRRILADCPRYDGGPLVVRSLLAVYNHSLSRMLGDGIGFDGNE
jgi:hypothetical protein